MLDADATARLVERARGGEREAFAALARAYLLPAYAVALAVLGRPSDAEDAAQEAMVTAFEKLDTCREPRRFASWLLQIARNRARNWRARRGLREAGRAGDVHELEIRDPASMAEPGTREMLVSALAKLSKAQREVVLLHDLEGLTHGEIGACVGISETMSRQHLFTARKALRALIGESDKNG